MGCNHDWVRTNGVTTEDGYDTFRCTKCHLTGKSFGLGGMIVEDSYNKSTKGSEGITMRRGRGKSLKTILKEGKERKNGLEWSWNEYLKRITGLDNLDE